MTETLTHIWKGAPDRLAVPQGDPSGDNLREFWLATRRQSWLVLLAAIAGLALGAFHFATSPARFYASTTILIEEMQSDLDQEISSLRPLTRNDTSFQNQFQILRSRHLAAEVVRELNLHENADFVAPPRSALGQAKAAVLGWVAALLSRPAAEPASGGASASANDYTAVQEAAALLVRRTIFLRNDKSYSVEVGFLSHNPYLATRIADAYARAYLADGTQANLQASDRTAAWMQERISEVRRAATAASEDAESFRAANKATDQQGLREREQRIDALNALLIALEARYQEHLLAGSFPVSNGRILSAALVPDKPSKPVAWQLLLAGLAAGGLLGLGLAVARELRETGFRTGEDVKALGLNFLGYLPVLHLRDRRSRLADEAPLALLLTARDEVKASVPLGGRARPRLSFGQSGAPAIVEDDLTIAASEAPYGRAARGILWSIDMAGEDGKARILGVSGLSRGEGATTLAVNLAEQATENGGRVLLVDADFAATGLTGFIPARGETPPEPSPDNQPLRSVRRLRSHVHVLTAPKDGAPVSARVTAIRSAIAAAATSYDLVIVDMPPLTHPDAASLLRSLDGIVMAVRWGHTSRRSVEAFLGRSPGFRRKTFGAVLNRAEIGRLVRYGVPAEECAELAGRVKKGRFAFVR